MALLSFGEARDELGHQESSPPLRQKSHTTPRYGLETAQVTGVVLVVSDFLDEIPKQKQGKLRGT